MMIPLRAATEIAPMIAIGMAINSGHGVAITITGRKRCGSPPTIQANVATAIAPASRSAPNSPAITCLASSMIKGMPPTANARIKGASKAHLEALKPYLRRIWAPMATVAEAAT